MFINKYAELCKQEDKILEILNFDPEWLGYDIEFGQNEDYNHIIINGEKRQINSPELLYDLLLEEENYDTNTRNGSGLLYRTFT